MCWVSVNQKSINDGFFSNTRAFISAVCGVSCPPLPEGGRAGEPSSPPAPPPPVLSASWEMKSVDLNSLSELFLFNMEIAVSARSPGVPPAARLGSLSADGRPRGCVSTPLPGRVVCPAGLAGGKGWC